jgi:hypothetical protein
MCRNVKNTEMKGQEANHDLMFQKTGFSILDKPYTEYSGIDFTKLIPPHRKWHMSQNMKSIVVVLVPYVSNFVHLCMHYDCFSIRIDKYNSKEIKESIFLAEAREMQNQLLKAAEEVQDASQSLLPSVPVPSTVVRIMLPVETGYLRSETYIWICVTFS